MVAFTSRDTNRAVIKLLSFRVGTCIEFMLAHDLYYSTQNLDV